MRQRRFLGLTEKEQMKESQEALKWFWDLGVLFVKAILFLLFSLSLFRCILLN